MTTIIDGKGTAQAVRAELREEIAVRRKDGLRAPGLAVILVGDGQDYSARKIDVGTTGTGRQGG